MDFDKVIDFRKTNFSWSNQEVDILLVKKVINNVISKVPSKQNKFPYCIDVLDWSDPALRNTIFTHTHRDKAISIHDDPGNPQTLAPVLLVFTHREMSDNDIGKSLELKKPSYKNKIANIEIGIVSAMLMLAFENEGLATGLCQCINETVILGSYIDRNEIILLMGVGYPGNKDTYHDPRINDQKSVPNFHNEKPSLNKIVTYRLGE